MTDQLFDPHAEIAAFTDSIEDQQLAAIVDVWATELVRRTRDDALARLRAASRRAREANQRGELRLSRQDGSEQSRQ